MQAHPTTHIKHYFSLHLEHKQPQRGLSFENPSADKDNLVFIDDEGDAVLQPLPQPHAATC